MELAAIACAARAGASSDFDRPPTSISRAGPHHCRERPSEPFRAAQVVSPPPGCERRRPPGTPWLGLDERHATGCPPVPSVEPRRPSTLQIVAITQHHHSTTTRHRTDPRATTTITHAPAPPDTPTQAHIIYTRRARILICARTALPPRTRAQPTDPPLEGPSRHRQLHRPLQVSPPETAAAMFCLRRYDALPLRPPKRSGH